MPNPLPYKAYQAHQLDTVPGFRDLPKAVKDSVKIASYVFPFKVSHYLVCELIDWDRVGD